MSGEMSADGRLLDALEAEDLAWVDRRIEQAEQTEPVSVDAAVRLREYVERLRRIRERLVGL